MAFLLESLNNVSSGAAPNKMRVWTYKNVSDSLATIKGSGYFDPFKYGFHQDDVIYISGSDGVSQIQVTSLVNVTPVVTAVYGGGGIADGSVTVAMLADGVDGELITWDAAGVADTVATGTSGQLLTSNGAGAAPTFQAAAGGGMGSLISAQAASADTYINFDNVFDGTYKYYKIIVVNVLLADDGYPLEVQVGTGATPTYATGLGDYAWRSTGVKTATTITTAGDTTEAFISLVAAGVEYMGNTAGDSNNFELNIWSPETASTYTSVSFKSDYMNGSDGISLSGNGQRKAASATTSLRFLATGTTITSGDFYLYGFNAS